MHFQGQKVRSKVNLQGAGHIVAASRTACLLSVRLTVAAFLWVQNLVITSFPVGIQPQ